MWFPRTWSDVCVLLSFKSGGAFDFLHIFLDARVKSVILDKSGNFNIINALHLMFRVFSKVLLRSFKLNIKPKKGLVMVAVCDKINRGLSRGARAAQPFHKIYNKSKPNTAACSWKSNSKMSKITWRRQFAVKGANLTSSLAWNVTTDNQIVLYMENICKAFIWKCNFLMTMLLKQEGAKSKSLSITNRYNWIKHVISWLTVGVV